MMTLMCVLSFVCLSRGAVPTQELAPCQRRAIVETPEKDHSSMVVDRIERKKEVQKSSERSYSSSSSSSSGLSI